jgi:phage major head subunit gpT-like protein
MIVNSQNLSALTRGYQAVFKNAYGSSPSLKDKIATMVKSTNKTEDYGWINSMPRIREWVGDRIVKDLSLGSYAITNKKFESTVSVEREDIEDDRYGLYNTAMAELGLAAKEHPEELLFGLAARANSTVCYDGQYFLDTDHPVGSGVVSNYTTGAGELWMLLDTGRPLKPFIFQERKPYNFTALTNQTDSNVFYDGKMVYGVDARCNVGFGLWQLAYGSKATLDATSFNAARAAMRSLESDEGRKLNVSPTTLVVGPSNEAAARAIVAAEFGSSGASNINYKAVELIVTPFFS